MRCECTLLCCSTLTWCILGCGCVPVVAQGVLRRQVKGARWQNAWCVAYFLGFDLPRIHSFEENEDELQQRGHPLAGERTYQQMDKKKCFSHSPFPFASFSASCAFLFFLHFSQFHSNGVFGVSWRFTGRFWTSSWLSQQTTDKQNRGKWITLLTQNKGRFHLAYSQGW